MRAAYSSSIWALLLFISVLLGKPITHLSSQNSRNCSVVRIPLRIRENTTVAAEAPGPQNELQKSCGSLPSSSPSTVRLAGWGREPDAVIVDTGRWTVMIVVQNKTR